MSKTSNKTQKPRPGDFDEEFSPACPICRRHHVKRAVKDSLTAQSELTVEYQRGYDMALDMASLTVLDYKWQKGSSNFNQGFMAGKILSMKSKTPAAMPNDGAMPRAVNNQKT